MARRRFPPGPWRFYVYELGEPGDLFHYVGKGSGRRLNDQKRRFCLPGREVARFFDESDAYQYERQRITDYHPILNRHPGGNGSKAQRQRRQRASWEIEMERVGTRVNAARALLRFGRRALMEHGSTIENIRRLEQIAGEAAHA